MTTYRIIALASLTTLASIAGCDQPRPQSNTGVNTNQTATRTTSTSPANTTATTTSPRTSTTTVPDADNTARNKGDGDTHSKTPIDQSESSADIRITAAIRRAIMDDDTMSMNAKNCKIITEKTGLVTLRGVVDSQAEKDSIGAIATAVAGVTKVDNLLEVKVR